MTNCMEYTLVSDQTTNVKKIYNPSLNKINEHLENMNTTTLETDRFTINIFKRLVLNAPIGKVGSNFVKLHELCCEINKAIPMALLYLHEKENTIIVVTENAITYQEIKASNKIYFDFLDKNEGFDINLEFDTVDLLKYHRNESQLFPIETTNA